MPCTCACACPACVGASVAGMIIGERTARSARAADAAEDAENAPDYEVAPMPTDDDRRCPHCLDLKDVEEFRRPGIFEQIRDRL